MPSSKIFWLRILINIAALVPLALLIWHYTQGQLTANPVQQIQLRTGYYSLIFMTLTLACRPIRQLLQVKMISWLHHTLGLYAFMYASLHVLNFVALDYRFDFDLMFTDIVGKRYIYVGLAAYVILLTIAVTSIRWLMIKMGKNWQRLHWWVLLAAILSVVHFFWQSKAEVRRPIIFAVLLALLLLVRIPYVSDAISSVHTRLVNAKTKY